MPSTITICGGFFLVANALENGQGVSVLLNTLNEWIPVVSALLAGLIFIWRIFYKLNVTLVSLNNSVNRLNEHLNDVDEKATKSAKRIENHEIRIVIIERELGIKQKDGEVE